MSEGLKPAQNELNNEQPIPQNLRREFEQRKPEIEHLYRQAAFWHGTGRYQYRHNEIVDILQMIVNMQGLVPHKDRWDVKTGLVKTISLTTKRMYAALYARMHQTDNEELQYEYLTRDDWSKPIVLDTYKQMAKGAPAWTKRKALGVIRGEYVSSPPVFSYKKSKREWYKKVRAQPSDTYKDKLRKIRSDIEGNYPILIGIKEGSFTPAQTAKYIALHEVRSETPISLDNFTHIEVPMAHLEETQQALQERGISQDQLPVIPMELGEIHASQFSKKQLIRSNPFREELAS